MNHTTTASRFNHREMKIYGGNPMKDEQSLVECKDCSKKILKQGFVEHTANCEKIKTIITKNKELSNINKEQAATTTTTTTNTSTTTTTNATTSTTATTTTSTTANSNKKRKKLAVNEAGDVTEQNKRPSSPSSVTKPPEAKKQKAKKEQSKKKSTGRNKGPIDLDKQCGVLMPPSNSPCARSLTCKSHSMHLKRSVVGRSAPYDQLLASYQKKSIGRPQNNCVAGNKQENGKKDGRTEVQEKEDIVINSDEEVDAVLEAIMRSKPRPLVTRPDTYVPPTANYFLCNELLSKAK